MNVRKPIDYSTLFAALDRLMAAALPQMELYCKIGKLVSSRLEKGAAVAAAEYLNSAYPDASGFSPRNLRRMREFYRTYETAPEVLAEAMTIGWTQNVVILEAELTLQERAWYIRAVQQFGWPKLKLLEQIKSAVHLEIALDLADEVCYTEGNAVTGHISNDTASLELPQEQLLKADGPARNNGYSEGSRTGNPLPYRIRYQYQKDWPFGRSSDSQGAQNRLYLERSSSTRQQRLQQIHPAGFSTSITLQKARLNGSGEVICAADCCAMAIPILTATIPALTWADATRNQFAGLRG